MGTALALAYVAGVIGSVVVQRHRAGVTQRGSLGVETVVTSLPWFLTSMGKMMVWPAVLVVWFANGKPPSPWRCTDSRSGGIRVRRVGAAA